MLHLLLMPSHSPTSSCAWWTRTTSYGETELIVRLMLIEKVLNFCRSGLPNFIAVSLALNELGYKAVGIRLDSGDLAYLSVKCREAFVKVAEK